MLTCISLAAKFEGEYDVLEAVFQYLVEVPFAPSKSEVWLAETQIWDEFSQHNQCNLDFQSVFDVLEDSVLKNLRNNECFQNFVDNLVLYTFYEKGDLFSHCGIALGAVMLFLECYNLQSNFRLLKKFVEKNKNRFHPAFTDEIIEIRNYLMENTAQLVEDEDLVERLSKLRKWESRKN